MPLGVQHDSRAKVDVDSPLAHVEEDSEKCPAPHWYMTPRHNTCARAACVHTIYRLTTRLGSQCHSGNSTMDENCPLLRPTTQDSCTKAQTPAFLWHKLLNTLALKYLLNKTSLWQQRSAREAFFNCPATTSTKCSVNTDVTLSSPADI